MAILCRGYSPPTAERHRKQHSGEPCRQQAIVRGTFKHSTAIIFPKNCRTQCDPQHPADGRKACSGERGTDELYCLWRALAALVAKPKQAWFLLTGTRIHNSLLLTSRKRHPSVGCCLPLKASRCHSGAPELVRFSVINNKITLPHFKHVLACSLNVNGL